MTRPALAVDAIGYTVGMSTKRSLDVLQTAIRCAQHSPEPEERLVHVYTHELNEISRDQLAALLEQPVDCHTATFNNSPASCIASTQRMDIHVGSSRAMLKST